MIGPYRVLRELGRGGMAVVYEADDTELARRVALKVLVGPAADEQGKRRFVREAQAQAKVNHEHVVTIYRVGEARGISYIAMPILNGQTLAQALTTVTRPPLSSTIRIGLEIAEGLAAAHAVGLIHRDIKPSNIWLEAPKLRVRILDFGLARPPHAESRWRHHHSGTDRRHARVHVAGNRLAARRSITAPTCGAWASSCTKWRSAANRSTATTPSV